MAAPTINTAFLTSRVTRLDYAVLQQFATILADSILDASTPSDTRAEFSAWLAVTEREIVRRERLENDLFDAKYGGMMAETSGVVLEPLWVRTVCKNESN